MKLKCTSCHKNISDNFIEKIFDNSHNGKSLVDTLIPKSFQEVTLSEVVVYGEDISKNIVYSKDDKKLSSGEISKLKKGGVDPHDLKPHSDYDLYKDRKGNIVIKLKNGKGQGEYTGYNINDF